MKLLSALYITFITLCALDPAMAYTNDANLTWAAGGELLIVFNFISQITESKLDLSKLLASQRSKFKGSPYSIELFREVALACHPSATDAQKKVFQNYGGKTDNAEDVINQVFKVQDSMPIGFEYNEVLYKGVKTFRGALESLSSDLPHVIKGAKSGKDLATNIGNYAGYMKDGRYKYFDSFVIDNSKEITLERYGIKKNDTQQYIQYTSNVNGASDLKSAVQKTNSDLHGYNFTVAMIQNAMVATEFKERLDEVLEGIESL